MPSTTLWNGSINNMPEYLSILREASVASIYFLFVFVILLFIIKGKIQLKEFQILFYIWLPTAVVTQFLMTYFRLSLGKSNLLIMNIYLIFEYVILVIVLLMVRERTRGIKPNYKLWGIILAAGVLTHFIYDFETIHNAAMLFIAIIYFQLTVNYIDLNKVDKFYLDQYSLLNITIFIKAIGYSYFLIYQTDYRFPLSIFSGVNLIVQFLFGITIWTYYRNIKIKKTSE
jgi:hypothetical protein